MEKNQLKSVNKEVFKQGVPCGLHKGCLSHVTKPCEGCGRIAGKYIAPWTDFNCNKIYEGDTIVHPGGSTAKVVHDTSYRNDWRAVYEDGESCSLCLQVGDKGRAVVVKPEDEKKKHNINILLHFMLNNNIHIADVIKSGIDYLEDTGFISIDGKKVLADDLCKYIKQEYKLY